jgi:hypothetical protein
MAILQEAQAILREAEGRLRESVSRAVAEGRYDDVVQLADLARQIGALLGSTAHPDVPVEGVGKVVSAHRSAAGGKPTASPARARDLKRGRYPQFVREGAYLVKIGWSKRARAEYEHKAPQEAVLAFSDGLLRAGRRVTVDEMMPVKLPDGREIPSYQVYLSLAWLRGCGLVAQHGRNGYSVPNRKDLAARLGAEWARLPER